MKYGSNAERQRTHPKAIHTMMAQTAFVAAMPKVLIIGRTTAMPAAISTDRRPLKARAKNQSKKTNQIKAQHTH